MSISQTETALHWTCPACGLEWVDAGSGFHDYRFSACLRCGADAYEGRDTRPTRSRTTEIAPTAGQLMANGLARIKRRRPQPADT
jgi:hypothetical protein